MPSTAFNTSYEAHSAEPEYIETNRSLIRSLDLSEVSRLLDLACGTGLLSDLVLEQRPGITVCGLDLDRQQLKLTEERFGEKGLYAGNGASGAARGLPSFILVEGSADTLPFASGTMDAVLMGNSIHNLPDPGRLVGEIRRVLRPGGLFAFNSAFYAGTYVPGTEKFHQAWVKEALIYVMNRDRELRAKGEPGLKRKRGTVSRASARRWLLPREWQDVLESNGLRVSRVHEREVRMTRRSYETVGSYGGFASVVLAGYPVELACEALQAAVQPALDQTGFTTVPARWLEMAALKPEGPDERAKENR
ncbi:MAG: class I SAM-dependent methyltransferase [Deltaproteobacteria bacterium]|nr:class I SAM-dependent methyltransferase [Deltaproteobacteria bacterium]